jgi:hypothetical protein
VIAADHHRDAGQTAGHQAAEERREKTSMSLGSGSEGFGAAAFPCPGR